MRMKVILDSSSPARVQPLLYGAGRKEGPRTGLLQAVGLFRSDMLLIFYMAWPTPNDDVTVTSYSDFSMFLIFPLRYVKYQ